MLTPPWRCEPPAPLQCCVHAGWVQLPKRPRLSGRYLSLHAWEGQTTLLLLPVASHLEDVESMSVPRELDVKTRPADCPAWGSGTFRHMVCRLHSLPVGHGLGVHLWNAGIE